jgi:hypothetical protein
VVVLSVLVSGVVLLVSVEPVVLSGVSVVFSVVVVLDPLGIVVSVVFSPGVLPVLVSESFESGSTGDGVTHGDHTVFVDPAIAIAIQSNVIDSVAEDSISMVNHCFDFAVTR